MKRYARLGHLALIIALIGGISTYNAHSTTALPTHPTTGPYTLPTPWHARLPAGAYPGIWHFQDLDIAAVRFPYLRGTHRVWGWYELNPAPGIYRWDLVEAWINQAVDGGKPVALGVNTYDGVLDGGDRTPRWVYQQAPHTQLTCPDGWTFPKFWDKTWQHYFESFITAFAERYDRDPRIAWVEISVGVYGETSPISFTQTWYRTNCLEPAGLDSVQWEQTVKDITDIYTRHFHHTPLFLQMFPKYISWRERREFTNYAASQRVGLKSNGLRAEEGTADFGPCPPDSNNYWSTCEAGLVQLMRKWGERVPIAWEGDPRYFRPPNIAVDPNHPEWAIYWQILNALDKHSDYILYKDTLAQNPALRPLFEWANQYLGRTIHDTPSIWVALRETSLPNAYHPQRGNYTFWLYQNDHTPGGRSTPVWDVGPYPQGYYARRTDESAGNPYLYFDVDDTWWAIHPMGPVVVQVTYLDQGDDTWALDYDATSGPYTRAGIIHKTNTGQWKTAEFLLTDPYFKNRQPGGGGHPGSDFRINSLGDGDEIVHMVDVRRLHAPIPTPTPTPIRPPYTPPTPTPGPVLHIVKLQEGKDGYQGTEDTFISRDHPYTNFGREKTLDLCLECPGTGDERHILIRFDLKNTLPEDANIQFAWLALNAQHVGAKGLYARAYALLRPWSEMAATWVESAPGDPWFAAGASEPAADRAQTWSGQGAVVQVDRWLRLDISDVIRAAWNQPARNFGVVLLPFHTRGASYTFASAEHKDITKRPLLIIGYTRPESPTPSPTATPTSTPTPTPIPPIVQWLIQGNVFNATSGPNTPIANSTITLTLGTAGPVITTFSNESGTFSAVSYAPDTGALRYEVSAPGYAKIIGEEPPRHPRHYQLAIGLRPLGSPSRLYLPSVYAP